MHQKCARHGEFSHELTSYAVNAALAMSDIVNYASSSPDHIAYVSTLAHDSFSVFEQFGTVGRIVA